jgi:hypothetical protein
MVALPSGSLHRDRFFEILKSHGCVITQISRDRIRIERDSDHFLEVWVIADTQQFIYPDTIRRVAELLGIDPKEFIDPNRPDVA